MSKLLYFGAEWCSACKALWPVVAKEAESKGFDVKFLDMDSDEGAIEAEKRRIKGLPTLVVVDENGNEVKRAVGSTAWREIQG
jgi:thiol-disulfide isomerase/thioredoxin